MKRSFLAVVSLIFLFAAQAGFAQLSAGDYALIIKGNATFAGGHVDDGAIVGGVLKTTGNLQFGNGFGSNNSAVALVVGGSVNAGGNQIALFNQSYYFASGSAGLNLQNPGVALAANPLLPATIDGIFDQFEAMSAGMLSQVGATPAYSFSEGKKLTITAIPGQVNVITLTEAQLSAYFSGNNLEIHYAGITDQNTKLIINYVGTGGTLNFNAKTMGLNATTYDQVLWNMVNVATLNVGNGADSFRGSILAPETNVTWNANNLDGQLIAASYTGSQSREVHNHAFITDLLEPPSLTPVPEPGTYGLMGAGLLAGVVGARRWLRRKSGLKTV